MKDRAITRPALEANDTDHPLNPEFMVYVSCVELANLWVLICAQLAVKTNILWPYKGDN